MLPEATCRERIEESMLVLAQAKVEQDNVEVFVR